MTLNLTEAEMDALEAICEEKGISKTALVRQALRLYKSVDERLARGEKVYVESADKTEKAELMVL
ncbi:ribbon-helix-helix protein, CopG family [Rhizobium leguminosarum]|nr:ribbon-helix-helix protein, CopG family [Rhizobium rhizogenes]NEJ06821.1 ribbon-helix-helix protein, CopG family [Rhizobium ruizarguesonis]NTG08850.1 ribbon-helix-helix protein, CopG family [Rhizobium rhizogenes]